MTAQAPICHVPPEVAHDQPKPVALPAIPVAEPTIASLTATVNAMRQVIMILSGQLAQGPQGPRGAAGQNANAKGTWTEAARVTENVVITNPNDSSQSVTVQRINRLVMRNKDTGQTWEYNH